MLERAALQPGEYGLVDGGSQLGGAEDGTPPRSAQGLVSGEGNDVGHADRVGVDSTGDQPGDVGGVEEEQGADVVGDAPDRLRDP